MIRWGLPLALVLAAALRLPTLGWKSLWTDEIANLMFAQAGVVSLLRDIAPVESNPPGHPLILAMTIPLLGTEEWALRLPSALAGIATVWLVFLVCRRAFGPQAAVAAALLAAVHPFFVQWSMDARAYAFLPMFTCLMMLAGQGMAGTSGVPRAGWTALLAFAALALIHLHGAGAVAVVATGTFTLAAILLGPPAQRWPSVVALAAAALVVAAGSAWWLLTALQQVAAPDFQAGWNDGTQPPLAVITMFVRAWFSPLVGSLITEPPLDPVLRVVRRVGLAAFVLLLVLGTVLAFRPVRPFLAGLAGMALGFVLAAQVQPLLTRDTAIIGLSFLWPLAGAGFAAIPRAVPRVALASAIVVPHVVLVLANHAQPGPREDLRQMARALEQERQPGDALIIASAFEAAALSYYGHDLNDHGPVAALISTPARLIQDVAGPRAEVPVVFPEQVCAATAGAKQVWLAVPRWRQFYVSRAPAEQLLDGHGLTPLARRELPDFTLLLMERDDCR